jgi:phage gpG-like protein
MAKFNESRKLKLPLQKFKREAPKLVDIMLTDARNFFEENFRKQGFDNNSVAKWEPRKREFYRTRSGKIVDDTTRGILIGKGRGRLWRSLRKKRLNAFSGLIFSEVPYAKVHNEGLRAGRGRGFKMDKRQFVGYSEKLNKKLRFKIESKINNIFA